MLRAGQIQPGALDGLRPPLPLDGRDALELWQALGRTLDWSALDVVLDLRPPRHVDLAVELLMVIRDTINDHLSASR